MTDSQKLITIKTMLEDGSGYMPSDETLNAYIEVAHDEILAWMYHLVGGVPSGVVDVPSKYDSTQIYAVIAGWTHAGTEGQSVSVENGVHRHFNYTDMLDYIHNHVLPFVRVGAVSAS
jgi:hypothetical protein